MRSAPIIVCVWPGLARLWLRGDMFGLAIAVVFAVMLNLALLLTFVWMEWFSVGMRQVVWGSLALVWIIAAWRNYRKMPQLVATDTQLADEDLFHQAQTEYLRGHWVEAESILERIVRNFPNDVDARFMLATLQRHTGHPEEARRQLKAIGRLPGSQKWCLEISQEQTRLTQTNQTENTNNDDQQEDDSTDPDRLDFAQAA